MLPHAIRLAALIPILAGLAGALAGTAPVAALALLGLGLLATWSAGDLRRRGAVFEALCAVAVLGGLARLAGLCAGPPGWPPWLALTMELIVAPCLWFWWQAAHALEAPRPGE